MERVECKIDGTTESQSGFIVDEQMVISNLIAQRLLVPGSNSSNGKYKHMTYYTFYELYMYVRACSSIMWFSTRKLLYFVLYFIVDSYFGNLPLQARRDWNIR